MSVATTDLTTPAGELDVAVLWPGEDSTSTDARLAGFLTAATTQLSLDIAAKTLTLDQAAQDLATKEYAYYRAFSDVYVRKLSTPTSVTIVDQGSKSTSVEQIKGLLDIAMVHKANYDAILATGVDGTHPGTAETSGAMRTCVGW